MKAATEIQKLPQTQSGRQQQGSNRKRNANDKITTRLLRHQHYQSRGPERDQTTATCLDEEWKNGFRAQTACFARIGRARWRSWANRSAKKSS